MGLKEFLENWITGLISGTLGGVLIYWAVEIKPPNDFWWIALFSGIVFISPFSYFRVWKWIKEHI
ncbi:MAG: hypothetical protein AABX44_01640 [Nanoarchaeota archaeon]